MIRCIFFIVLISIGSQAWAQSPANSRSDTTSINSDSATNAVLANTSGTHIIWHDIKDGFYDLGQYVLRPFNWDLREWGIIATGIGFTAILETADDVPLR